MSGYYVKNPAAVMEQSFDWSAGHLNPGESIASDLGWSVEPAEGPPERLVVTTATTTATHTTAHLSGGVPGDGYLVASTIETDTGRRLVRSVIVRAANH